jgi:hypothetical protein
MDIFKAWHSEAVDQYTNYLSSGNYCRPNEFQPDDFTDNYSTFELWDLLEDEFYIMYLDKDEEMLGYLMDMLYEEFKKEMDTHLYDVEYDMGEEIARARMGDDAWFGVRR